jgi:hypothetical protein
MLLKSIKQKSFICCLHILSYFSFNKRNTYIHTYTYISEIIILMVFILNETKYTDVTHNSSYIIIMLSYQTERKRHNVLDTSVSLPLCTRSNFSQREKSQAVVQSRGRGGILHLHSSTQFVILHWARNEQDFSMLHNLQRWIADFNLDVSNSNMM